jgi:two-component sensor histidine kinase
MTSNRFFLLSKKIAFILFLIFLSTSNYAQIANQNDDKKQVEVILEYIKNSDNKKNEKIELYYSLCKIYQKNDVNKSNYYAEKLLTFSNEINNKKGISYYYLIKSYNFIYKGQYNEAIKTSKMASFLLSNKLYSDLHLEAIYFQVVANYFLGNHEYSKHIALDAIHHNKDSQAFKQIGLLFNLIGANYSNLDKLHLSILNLQRAVFYFERAKDKNGLMNSYNQIADIYLKTNQNVLALNYSDKSLQIAKEINNIDLQSYTILLLFNAEINLKLRKISTASKKLIIANDLLKKIENNGLKTSYLLLKADLSYLNQNYKEGIYYCNEAAELNVDYEFSRSRTKYKLAKFYHELKQAKKARFYYQQIESELKKVNFQYIGIINSDFYKDFAINEEMLGDFKNAYRYLQYHTKWQGIKLGKENQDKIYFLLAKYEINQKNIEIKNSIIEKQKIVVELQNHKNKMYFIVAILFLTLILFLFFFFQFKKEKIFNSLLSEKAKTIEEKNLVIEKSNSKLEQLLKTKEVLLKEIHHRVKNNLQLVMSLLRSQARHGGDEDISSFIEKSQSRIEVIALIHQNLYQTEYVENVNIQDYISSLSEAIVISYQKDNAKIDVKVNAYDVFLDISIAIPIGLIINELITNAIKYAYPNAKYGLISVDLKAVSDYDFELVITDYGVGIDDYYEEKKTFGMELVFLLTEQIGGKLVLINKNGLQYFITFNINNHD